jgi:hypothetical protein
MPPARSANFLVQNSEFCLLQQEYAYGCNLSPQFLLYQRDFWFQITFKG